MNVCNTKLFQRAQCFKVFAYTKIILNLLFNPSLPFLFLLFMPPDRMDWGKLFCPACLSSNTKVIDLVTFVLKIALPDFVAKFLFHTVRKTFLN